MQQRQQVFYGKRKGNFLLRIKETAANGKRAVVEIHNTDNAGVNRSAAK
jgi:hypothetical protein